MRTPAQRATSVAVRVSSEAEFIDLVARAGRRTDSGKNMREMIAGMFARTSEIRAF